MTTPKEEAATEWVIVPIDASPEMAKAWDDAYYSAPQGSGHALAWEMAWQAMLAAAPTQPSGEVERLRTALEQIAAHPVHNVVRGRPELGIPGFPSCQETARAALNGGESNG